MIMVPPVLPFILVLISTTCSKQVEERVNDANHENLQSSTSTTTTTTEKPTETTTILDTVAFVERRREDSDNGNQDSSSSSSNDYKYISRFWNQEDDKKSYGNTNGSSQRGRNREKDKESKFDRPSSIVRSDEKFSKFLDRNQAKAVLNRLNSKPKSSIPDQTFLSFLAKQNEQISKTNQEDSKESEPPLTEMLRSFLKRNKIRKTSQKQESNESEEESEEKLKYQLTFIPADTFKEIISFYQEMMDNEETDDISRKESLLLKFIDEKNESKVSKVLTTDRDDEQVFHNLYDKQNDGPKIPNEHRRNYEQFTGFQNSQRPPEVSSIIRRLPPDESDIRELEKENTFSRRFENSFKQHVRKPQELSHFGPPKLKDVLKDEKNRELFNTVLNQLTNSKHSQRYHEDRRITSSQGTDRSRVIGPVKPSFVLDELSENSKRGNQNTLADLLKEFQVSNKEDDVDKTKKQSRFFGRDREPGTDSSSERNRNPDRSKDSDRDISKRKKNKEQRIHSFFHEKDENSEKTPRKQIKDDLIFKLDTIRPPPLNNFNNVAREELFSSYSGFERPKGNVDNNFITAKPIRKPVKLVKEEAKSPRPPNIYEQTLDRFREHDKIYIQKSKNQHQLLNSTLPIATQTVDPFTFGNSPQNIHPSLGTPEISFHDRIPVQHNGRHHKVSLNTNKNFALTNQHNFGQLSGHHFGQEPPLVSRPLGLQGDLADSRINAQANSHLQLSGQVNSNPVTSFTYQQTPRPVNSHHAPTPLGALPTPPTRFRLRNPDLEKELIPKPRRVPVPERSKFSRGQSSVGPTRAHPKPPVGNSFRSEGINVEKHRELSHTTNVHPRVRPQFVSPILPMAVPINEEDRYRDSNGNLIVRKHQTQNQVVTEFPDVNTQITENNPAFARTSSASPSQRLHHRPHSIPSSQSHFKLGPKIYEDGAQLSGAIRVEDPNENSFIKPTPPTILIHDMDGPRPGSRRRKIRKKIRVRGRRKQRPRQPAIDSSSSVTPSPYSVADTDRVTVPPNFVRRRMRFPRRKVPEKREETESNISHDIHSLDKISMVAFLTREPKANHVTQSQNREGKPFEEDDEVLIGDDSSISEKEDETLLDDLHHFTDLYDTNAFSFSTNQFSKVLPQASPFALEAIQQYHLHPPVPHSFLISYSQESSGTPSMNKLFRRPNENFALNGIGNYFHPTLSQNPPESIQFHPVALPVIQNKFIPNLLSNLNHDVRSGPYNQPFRADHNKFDMKKNIPEIRNGNFKHQQIRSPDQNHIQLERHQKIRIDSRKNHHQKTFPSSPRQVGLNKNFPVEENTPQSQKQLLELKLEPPQVEDSQKELADSDVKLENNPLTIYVSPGKLENPFLKAFTEKKAHKSVISGRKNIPSSLPTSQETFKVSRPIKLEVLPPLPGTNVVRPFPNLPVPNFQNSLGDAIPPRQYLF